MLKTVINDLRAFLFTLLILIFFFGNALVILGIGIDPTTLIMNNLEYFPILIKVY